MLEAVHIGLPVHILLTKSDKLTKGAVNAALFQVRNRMQNLRDSISVQLFSAISRQGIDPGHIRALDLWFEIGISGDTPSD